MKKFLAITLIAMFLLVGLAAADRLPPAVPENQLINSVEYVNVLGPVMKSVSLISEQSSAYLHNGILRGSFDMGVGDNIDEDGSGQALGEVVSQTTYRAEMLTNGGLIDSTYTFGYDTTNSISEAYNLETDWIWTYASVDGSTLAASERATLDVAGNYQATDTSMRCVFAQAANPVMPAFCNVVTVESTYASVTSMAVQTTLDLRDTAATADVGAEVHYKVNVDPNAAQGGQYADGQVGVTFTASIREANGYLGLDTVYYDPTADPTDVDSTWTRDYWDQEARVTDYVSTTTVTGGITKLTKQFDYNSAIAW